MRLFRRHIDLFTSAGKTKICGLILIINHKKCFVCPSVLSVKMLIWDFKCWQSDGESAPTVHVYVWIRLDDVRTSPPVTAVQIPRLGRGFFWQKLWPHLQGSVLQWSCEKENERKEDAHWQTDSKLCRRVSEASHQSASSGTGTDWK